MTILWLSAAPATTPPSHTDTARYLQRSQTGRLRRATKRRNLNDMPEPALLAHELAYICVVALVARDCRCCCLVLVPALQAQCIFDSPELLEQYRAAGAE